MSVRYLTTSEVADRFGVSADTVCGWIANGALRALDVSGPGAKRRAWRIHPDAVTEFEAARTAKPVYMPSRSLVSRRRKRPAATRYF